MENKVFKSERNTQIVIEKKFDISVGDEIEIVYLKNNENVITKSSIKHNGEFIGIFSLDELEEFLSLFLVDSI